MGKKSVILTSSVHYRTKCNLSSCFSDNSDNYHYVCGCRVGGSMPVIFTYFGEFQPKVRRGQMISVLAMFWMAGNIMAAGKWNILVL